MKKTFITALAVLFIACFMKMNFFITPTSQAIAQSPREEREESLKVAIKKFMEQEAEQAHRKHPNHEQEQQVELHKHQIENLHIAAKHLEAAGAHDLAHQIHREAVNRETKLRELLKQTMHHRHASQPQRETHELLHQIKQELHQLKMEIRELREVVAQRSPKPEK
ncbi:MAG: hypothetical protein QM501_08540 [Gimesia sp.]